MKLHTSLPLLAAALVLACTGVPAQAQDETPYTEGPVVNVSYIRTEPGRFDEYMRYLATTYRQIMEEQKKAGLILDYAVYQAEPRSPDEPDLILTTTFRNWAAYDGLRQKSDPIISKVFGSLPEASKASAERGSLRKELGSQTIQQLLLK